MKTDLIRCIARLCSYGSLALLLAGCGTVRQHSLTYKLWTNENLRRFAEPAADPRLELFKREHGDNVLVQYDEVRELDDKARRRSYFLSPNVSRIARGKRPRFVGLRTAIGMERIPQAESFAVANNHSPLPLCVAVPAKGGHEFTLYRNAASEGPYSLPVYPQSNGIVIRVALTPLAVGGDAVMVGVVASVTALYLSAANSLHNENQP